MTHIRAAGALVVHRSAETWYVLVLKIGEDKHNWDFPKGHLEPGESDKEGALRETKEETGLDVTFLNGFFEEIEYTYTWEGQPVHKTVAIFLAEASTAIVTVSHEHTGFEWMSFPVAIKKAPYSNQRMVLKKAQEFLCKIHT